MKPVRCCMVVLSIGIGSSLLAADSPHYVGADKCAKMCHKSEKKGNQYGVWKKESHSNAYQVLATDKAKEVARKAGLTGDPQKSPECLKCHVTAFGVKHELIDSTFKMEDGVQCETCHGAGSNYMKLSVMKDKTKAIAAGLIEPNEQVCVKCHNESSPTYKPFNYQEKVKKIAHPNPMKTAAK